MVANAKGGKSGAAPVEKVLQTTAAPAAAVNASGHKVARRDVWVWDSARGSWTRYAVPEWLFASADAEVVGIAVVAEISRLRADSLVGLRQVARPKVEVVDGLWFATATLPAPVASRQVEVTGEDGKAHKTTILEADPAGKKARLMLLSGARAEALHTLVEAMVGLGASADVAVRKALEMAPKA